MGDFSSTENMITEDTLPIELINVLNDESVAAAFAKLVQKTMAPLCERLDNLEKANANLLKIVDKKNGEIDGLK